MRFAVDHAFHIGQQHLRDGLPCQDYALSGAMPGGAYAVISDGCSTGGRTDIGSRLMALGMATAIQQVPRLLPGDDYVALQSAQVNTSARVLHLPPSDLLATCVYAVVRENGEGLIHILGDGVAAIIYRDGPIYTYKVEWAQNAPAYPVYQRDQFAAFTHAQGGADAPAMSVTVVNGHYAGETKYPVRNGIHGYQIFINPGMAADVAGIAVFSDGVCQVDGMGWYEAVTELVGFKTTAGNFVKRRLRGFLKSSGAKGRGPIDDISMAVIRFDREGLDHVG